MKNENGGSEKWARRRRKLLRKSIVLATGLTAFLVFLWVHAERQPSRQLKDMPEPTSTGSIDQSELSQVMAEFLSVPSYSFLDRSRMQSDRFSELHAILERRFPETHRLLDRDVVNDLSLLYYWKGQDASLKPMLLMSHLDVVPAASEKWSHKPHDGDIADGYIWGRGAMDVKSGVIGIMAAIEQLVREEFVPQRSIYLAFGHDEEVGGEEGNAVIAERLAERNIRFEFVLDEGGAILEGVIPGVESPVAFVAIAEKRMAQLKMTAYGDGGHGSMPGRTATLNLAEAVTRIDRDRMPARLPASTATLFDFIGPEMPLTGRIVSGNRWLLGPLIVRQMTARPSTEAVVRSTLNVTHLSTEQTDDESPTVNRSATVCFAAIDSRLLPGDTPDDARRHILHITRDIRLRDGKPAIQCEVVTSTPPVNVASVESPAFLTIQRTIHQLFPDTIVAAGLTAVTTDSRWYFPVADNVYRFIPLRVTESDMPRVHGVDERIEEANLQEITRFYIQLIRNSASELNEPATVRSPASPP